MHPPSYVHMSPIEGEGGVLGGVDIPNVLNYCFPLQLLFHLTISLCLLNCLLPQVTTWLNAAHTWAVSQNK